MSTYADAIGRVSQKLRDSEAWPDAGTSDSEKLRLTYYAAMAVQTETPMQRLQMVTSDPVPVDTENIRENVDKYFYPENIFRLRNDFGIAYYLLDNEIFTPSQRLDLVSLLNSASNPLHANSKMFAIDNLTSAFFVVGAEQATLHHYPMPAKPSATSDTYPIDESRAGTDFELACSIVAAHVSGETIRDAGQVAHQTFLTQLYKDERIRANT